METFIKVVDDTTKSEIDCKMSNHFSKSDLKKITELIQKITKQELFEVSFQVLPTFNDIDTSFFLECKTIGFCKNFIQTFGYVLENGNEIYLDTTVSKVNILTENTLSIEMKIKMIVSNLKSEFLNEN